MSGQGKQEEFEKSMKIAKKRFSVCVCVREKEQEREREKEKERNKHSPILWKIFFLVSALLLDCSLCWDQWK